MIKLTENDVFTFGGEYYNNNNDFVIVDGHVNDEENIKLRQQILDDYEKARKYDERIRGLPVPEECNIYNGMTLKILLEKARKWDRLFELGIFKLNNEQKIVASFQVAKQNQQIVERLKKNRLQH